MNFSSSTFISEYDNMADDMAVITNIMIATKES